jgi:hypothetical protein
MEKYYNIAKEEFEAYERVRKSGQANMFDLIRVQQLLKENGTIMNQHKILAIMGSYGELKKHFGKDEE